MGNIKPAWVTWHPGSSGAFLLQPQQWRVCEDLYASPSFLNPIFYERLPSRDIRQSILLFYVVFSTFDAFYNGGYFRWVFWVRVFGCSQRPCVKTFSMIDLKWLMPFQHAIPLSLRELELHKRRDIQPREGLAVCWWKGGEMPKVKWLQDFLL